MFNILHKESEMKQKAPLYKMAGHGIYLVASMFALLNLSASGSQKW